MSDIRQKAWICAVCGYIHYGPEPPQECPVCGADSSQFDLLSEKDAPAEPAGDEQERIQIIIAGAGIAGLSAAETSRKVSDNSRILLLSNEKELPYYRLNLTRYLAGEISIEQLPVHPESWYSTNRIDLRRGVELTNIHPENKTISLDNGEILPYDRLVLAIGARPFIPRVDGVQHGKVMSLRTILDAEFILNNCQGVDVVCIGGGVLGLETAGALTKRGVRVTVLENQNWLLPRQLNQKAARIFEDFVKTLGVNVLTGVTLKELQGDGDVQRVLLDDGRTIPAGLVIFSAGVRSNTDPAVRAGLAVNLGIIVDDAMQTSQSEIFAAGDAVEHGGILYGTWSPAQAQGAVAGSSAARHPAVFHPLPPSIVLKVLGVDLFSTGRIASGSEDVLIEEASQNSYSGLFFEKGVLVGAILLGDASAAVSVKKAIEDRLDCSSQLSRQNNFQTILEYIQNI